MKEIEKNLNGNGLRIGIVQSRFNPEVCEGLLGACRAQLVQQGVRERRHHAGDRAGRAGNSAGVAAHGGERKF